MTIYAVLDAAGRQCMWTDDDNAYMTCFSRDGSSTTEPRKYNPDGSPLELENTIEDEEKDFYLDENL